MNKRIYIVTSGEYSGYSIDAVFSTIKLAQEYVDKFEDDYHQVEEYNLDEKTLNPNKLFFRVESKYYITHSIHATIKEFAYLDELCTKNKPISVVQEFEDSRIFSGVVRAKDKKHALKMLGEFTFSYNTQNPLPWLKETKK